MSIAAIGGFILNFMPCVLPVLSLKIINFVRSSNLDRRKASLFTIFGILSSFWVIAFIAIIFKSTGKYFGLGLNFQEPTFVIALSIIVTFFISVSLDRVVFKLPESVNSFLLNIKFQGQYIEHYFSGVIATVLSTPCTAPFLGSALFFSFQQSNLFIFFTFTFIALGFSTPYILMLIFPKALKFLPTSGKWMNNLKIILATLLIGTIIWLLYILEAQINLRGVVILFLFLVLIKFVLENDIYILKYPLIKLVIIFILLMFSFLLPKYSYLEDKKYQTKINSLWQKFEPQKIDSLIKSGKIVFVDITADWCITCKYNKYLVFSREKTIKMLSDPHIIAMRGDFTNYNFQIHDFLSKRKIPGIPYNVIFSSKFRDGLELPVLLSIKEIEDGLRQAK
jgi:suppressor for copper-sensitivity B